jgi:hypothetical protein
VKKMTEKLKQQADEITDTAENCGVEIALDDLKPTADVNGGYVPKATDVTLKRGVID